MRDISLHLLDLSQNSIKANASRIELKLKLDDQGILSIAIADDGCGMTKQMADSVMDPFVTSRTERKVGLGIPLFAQNARLSGGDLQIHSQLQKGTTVTATFNTRNIDCLPLGDLAQTFYSLVIMNPLKPDFLFEVETLKGAMVFDTCEIRQAVGGLPLNEPEIASWIHDALYEELTPILEGK